MDEITRNDIIKNIQWIFAGDNDEPTQIGSWLESVPIADGSIKGFRLFTGKHDCGYYAYLYALADKENAAIRWLQVAQSHNQGAQGQFAAHKDFTIEYLLGYEKAREYALKRAAIGDGGNLILQALNWLKKNLKAQEQPAEPREPRGDRPHGREL